MNITAEVLDTDFQIRSAERGVDGDGIWGVDGHDNMCGFIVRGSSSDAEHVILCSHVGKSCELTGSESMAISSSSRKGWMNDVETQHGENANHMLV